MSKIQRQAMYEMDPSARGPGPFCVTYSSQSCVTEAKQCLLAVARERIHDKPYSSAQLKCSTTSQPLRISILSLDLITRLFALSMAALEILGMNDENLSLVCTGKDDRSVPDRTASRIRC